MATHNPAHHSPTAGADLSGRVLHFVIENQRSGEYTALNKKANMLTASCATLHAVMVHLGSGDATIRIR